MTSQLPRSHSPHGNALPRDPPASRTCEAIPRPHGRDGEASRDNAFPRGASRSVGTRSGIDVDSLFRRRRSRLRRRNNWRRRFHAGNRSHLALRLKVFFGNLGKILLLRCLGQKFIIFRTWCAASPIPAGAMVLVIVIVSSYRAYILRIVESRMVTIRGGIGGRPVVVVVRIVIPPTAAIRAVVEMAITRTIVV